MARKATRRPRKSPARAKAARPARKPRAAKPKARAAASRRSRSAGAARTARAGRPTTAVRASRSTTSARATRSATSARAARPATAGRVRKSAVRPATKGRPLTRREIERFRRVLESERDRLTDELEAMEQHMPEVEQVSVDASGGYDEDLADVASDAFEREKGIAIENNVQALLEQVEEALLRIEGGTFGICASCGQPISIERLRAIPYARLCINCKAREEQAIPR